MTLRVAPMTEDIAPDAEGGLGALHTDQGNLPLEAVVAAVAITGLVATTRLTQTFRNPHPVPLEATYIFPLPDRAAVTAMRMTADDHVVEAELKERGQARAEYDAALAQGRRAAIAEEERPDVFTMRVGNILPGERVTVDLALVGPLSYEDGEATFRLPLVVAPRYIPGEPLGGPGAGEGTEADTDAVPDASRITPPVLLPGFPNPVRLGIEVELDPAGLPLGEVRSSLHAVVGEGNRLRINPGERANRDFILRLSYGEPDRATHTLTVTPDAGEDGTGTFRLTVLPPTSAAPPRPRDVVLLLDRSGSMQGWKMVAARRAAARIVDTLTAADRFAAVCFDDVVEHPPSLGEGLVAATDRHRFRAVEHLAQVDARGGTELLAPLTAGLALLRDSARDRVLVLVTDGQVGNEDQILAAIATGVRGVRVHAVGIDQAVNAGFLGRLAAVGGGRCELVESEDRLDGAMDRIHRRIGAPVVSDLELTGDSAMIAETVSPARLPDLFPGAPLVLTGRYRGRLDALHLVGRTRDGSAWSATVDATQSQDPALVKVWARAHLGDLADRYASAHQYAGDVDLPELERRITATSLRFGVLCRFTAWVAVDTRVVAAGEPVHRVIQPVEPAAGWDMLTAAPMRLMAAAMPAPGAAPMAARAAPGFAGGTGGRASAARSAPPAPYAMAEQAAEPERAPAPDLLAALAVEAERLRSAQDAPRYERRELLADLGTRLGVLLHELARHGTELADLRALATECADDRPLNLAVDDFEALWARACRLLAEAALTGPDDPAPRKAFWRRG